MPDAPIVNVCPVMVNAPAVRVKVPVIVGLPLRVVLTFNPKLLIVNPLIVFPVAPFMFNLLDAAVKLPVPDKLPAKGISTLEERAVLFIAMLPNVMVLAPLLAAVLEKLILWLEPPKVQVVVEAGL